MRRLRAWLRGPVAAALDRAKARDRRVMDAARGRRFADPSLEAAWRLVLIALEHQGTPSGNLPQLVGMLDGTLNLAGWDEFSIEDAEGGRVELAFLDERAVCERAPLWAALRALADELAA